MIKKRAPPPTAGCKVPTFNIEDDLPLVGELKDCRQLSDDRWQGTDVDGVIVEVRGGAMPPYLVVDTGQMRPLPNEGGFTHLGIIRLTRA
jgi:hypothetical protein